MKLKSIIATFIFAFATLSAYADITLPPKCEVALPRVLSTPLIEQRAIDDFLKKGKWGQNDTRDNYWQVYSDREGNVTYRDPDTKSLKCTTLKLNESLRIAKIVNGFALVYVEHQKTSFPQISKADVKGWVPMSHLLLWTSCPTDKIGVYQKALPIINVDKVDKSKEGEIALCYNNPEDKTAFTKINSGVNFYFIMKRDPNGLVLLSREAKLKGRTDQVLLGWVSPVSFVNWNQRVCLEPNWDIEAGTYFEEHHVEIPVYNQKGLKDRICTMPAGKKNTYPGREETRYRMYGESMRYPVLPGGTDDRSIYKITAFCTPDGKGHVARGDDGHTGQAEIETRLKDLSTVNLLIVIDGTSSMKGYFEAVQKQIMAANAFFSAQSANNNVRVGIVIYRDYPDGKYVAQHLPLRPCSSNDKELKEFLETGGGYGIRSVAKTAEEAMFNGINMALDSKLMGYNAQQSNLMFIIGDCGNALDDKKFTEEQLIKKVFDNKVEISSFQVYNAPSQPYKLFVQQTSNIIMKSLARLYGDENYKASKWREVQNGYEYAVSKSSNINKYYMGNLRYAANGEKMNISTLLNLMQDSFTEFSKTTEKKKGGVENAPSFLGMYADQSITEMTAGAKAEMTFYHTIFSPEALKTITRENMLLAKEGYTAVHDKESGYDYWKPVIYISQDELNNLMATFQPVMAATDSEDRMPYVNAMKQVAQTIAGNSDADVSGMTDKEIRALIAGLDAQSAAMQSGHTLGQILDPKVVKPGDYKKMMQDFKSKYRKLENLVTGGYPFSAERNGSRWYWIPVEDLP